MELSEFARRLSAAFGSLLKGIPMRLRRIFMAAILALIVLMLPQSVIPGPSAQAQTQRFAAGWVDMPAGYKFEHVDGPDFDVDYLFPKDSELNEDPTTLGLYTGTAPSFEPPFKGVRIRAGNFGNKKVKWHIWETVDENKIVYHQQTLIKIKGGFWHLFLTAPDMQRIQELLSILGSYRTK